VASKGEHACDVVACIRSSRSLVWRCAPEVGAIRCRGWRRSRRSASASSTRPSTWTHRTEGCGVPGAVVPSNTLVMAEVAVSERIDRDLDTLFEFQADPEASAMAALPSRDLPAFLEHEAKIKADPSMITRTIVAGGGVVGSMGSWEVEGERDVGFWIGRDHWETATRPRPFARSSTSTPTGRCTPTWRPQRRFQARAREVRLRTRPLGARWRRVGTRARTDRLTRRAMSFRQASIPFVAERDSGRGSRGAGDLARTLARDARRRGSLAKGVP
jgi:hypothetical protein